MTTFYTPINDAKATLTAAHAVGDNALVVDSVTPFGTPTTSAPVRVTVIRASGGQYAIFGVTNVNSSTLTLTIGAPLEGTTDITFASGDSVEVEITAGTIQDIHDALSAVVHTSGNETVGGQKTFTNLMTVTTSSASATGIIVKGSDSQSAHLQEWQGSDGTVNAFITKNGDLMVHNQESLTRMLLSGTAIPGYFGIWSGADESTATGANYLFLGNSGLTLFNGNPEIQFRCANVNGFLLTGAGGITKSVFGYMPTSSMGDAAAVVSIVPFNAFYKGLAVRGNASQVGNLQEWQDTSGAPLGVIKADGSWAPPHLADSAAATDSVYYSTTASKMVYKDGSGVVNALY